MNQSTCTLFTSHGCKLLAVELHDTIYLYKRSMCLDYHGREVIINGVIWNINTNRIDIYTGKI